MFSPALQKLQPFPTEILTSAIKTNRIHHAYMFENGIPFEQYWLAIELAKALNCQETQNYAPCNICKNCTWIIKGIHPALIVVSPVDFIVTDTPKPLALSSLQERRKSKVDQKIINVRQARFIKKILNSTSSYYRVIIFTNAVDDPDRRTVGEKFWGNYADFVNPPALVDTPENNRYSWIPLYLNKEVMHQEMANALLKTWEEPPPHVLFIFITENRNEMIDTLVSRCQVLPLVHQKQEPEEYHPALSEFMYRMALSNKNEALRTSIHFLSLIAEHKMNISEALSAMQRYYHKYLIETIDDYGRTKTYKQAIGEIESAKSLTNSYINVPSVIDDMFLKLSLLKTESY